MDNSIKVVSSDGAKTLETAYGHSAPVTCLSVSADSNYFVTGSRDTTVLLWRIHRVITSRSSSISDLSLGTTIPSSDNSGNLSNMLSEKSRRCRIEGPIHVLRGHLAEVLCCCVSSDLGVVVSCSQSSDVLLHSIRGRLIRRLAGVDAHALCLSSEGVIFTWNKHQHSLNTFTLNGTLISSARLPFSCSISCMEVSLRGESALIGVNSCREYDKVCNSSWDLESTKPGFDDSDQYADERKETNNLDISSPSICFLDLHTLKV